MKPSFRPARYITGERFGVFAPYIDSYLQEVCQQGYRPSTVVGHLRLIARLHRWLHARGHQVGELREDLLAQFLKCQRRCLRTPASGQARVLQRLLALLQAASLVPKAKPPRQTPIPAQRLLQRFRGFLLEESGLADSTVENYAWHIGQFLTWRFGHRAVRASSLRMPEILRFIRQTACGHSPQHAQHLVAALRALFRFLYLRGELARNLAPALPNVAHWTLAELPRFISAEQVQRVLESCDQQTGVGRRDYAILLLLARLGMRAGEVLRLELEDLDWRNARIAVRARKGSGLGQLPLSKETGRAIAVYLRRDRPRSASRRVFLRVRAPYAPLSDPGVISSLVRRALCRTNIKSKCTGAHLLRHSLATTMLQHGASLDEIGQLLRHRSPNSTAIYAKVDLAALRRLATVWPGGVR